MSFSCNFTQIFDFGYGSAVCQFLNGKELVIMSQVNKECKETLSKYMDSRRPTFSSTFTYIFDFGYGSNICQYLNGEELATMYKVNKECAETVSKYLEKKKIHFKRFDTGQIEIKILNTPRRFLSEYPVTSCGFDIIEKSLIFHFKRRIPGTDYYTSTASYRWPHLDPDSFWYIWIKCQNLNLKGLRKYQEKQRLIQEEARRKVALEARRVAFIAHTLKPKSWIGRPKF
jgi:hypothetical protein